MGILHVMDLGEGGDTLCISYTSDKAHVIENDTYYWILLMTILKLGLDPKDGITHSIDFQHHNDDKIGHWTSTYSSKLFV